MLYLELISLDSSLFLLIQLLLKKFRSEPKNKPQYEVDRVDDHESVLGLRKLGALDRLADTHH